MSATVTEEQQQTGTFVDAATRTEAQTDAPIATTPDPNPTPGETIEERAKKVAGAYGLTDTEYTVLLRTTCKDAPREIAAWFMMFCHHRRLDPFSKQVYLWNDKYEDRNVNGVTVKFPIGNWQVVTGIDGLRVIASRSPYYRGQLRPIWTFEKDESQPDGIARFAKAESQYGKIEGKRVAEECEIIVRRAIPQAPTDSSLYLEFFGIARFEEFCKYNFNGKIFGNWEVQPEHQLRIRAEAMALRMGFPEEVGGIYLEDEMRDRQDDAIAPPAPGTALATVDREPLDDEIDALAKELGFTKARVRIEADKAGGGKEGLRDALTAIKTAKEEQAPKGAVKGAGDAPAAVTIDGEIVPTAGETIPPVAETLVPIDETLAPAAPKRRRGQPDDSNEPVVEKALCNACKAKKGERHAPNCPIDETDEVPA